MIDSSLSLAIKIGDFCHQNNIRFIMADTFGVIGGIFCDFGPSFTITNPTGESPTSSMIAAISNETQALVLLYPYISHIAAIFPTILQVLKRLNYFTFFR
jgi:hypothetical protein